MHSSIRVERLERLTFYALAHRHDLALNSAPAAFRHSGANNRALTAIQKPDEKMPIISVRSLGHLEPPIGASFIAHLPINNS
ncbi:hypothetical protein [Rhizorhabdus argentea]|uniref:hypothetical protein n=1 Tax=Rhizorhabdus argentea TaxID=1387174 RepID=UPI0030ED11B9